MFHVVELLCSPRVPQVAVLALISVGFAGCSADMSTRLSQNSFSHNPFCLATRSHGSVRAAPVERRELPQYARPQSPQYQSQPCRRLHRGAAILSGRERRRLGRGRGLASYAPPAQPRLRPPARSRRVRSRRPERRSAGGTTIIVGTSDTLDTLSRHYNVSPAAILQANGYRDRAPCRRASN